MFRSADFEAMKKVEKPLKRSAAKTLFEEVPVGVNFYMMNELDKKPCSEGFGKNCEKFFLSEYFNQKKLSIQFSKIKNEASLKTSLPKTEKKQIEA